MQLIKIILCITPAIHHQDQVYYSPGVVLSVAPSGRVGCMSVPEITGEYAQNADGDSYLRCVKQVDENLVRS